MKLLFLLWTSFILSLGEIIYFYINVKNTLADMFVFTISFIIFVSIGIKTLLSFGKEEKKN